MQQRRSLCIRRAHANATEQSVECRSLIIFNLGSYLSATAGSMTQHIDAAISYLLPTNKVPRSYDLSKAAGGCTPRENCAHVERVVPIRDYRAANPSIDREGFELRRVQALSIDFDDDAAIRSTLLHPDRGTGAGRHRRQACLCVRSPRAPTKGRRRPELRSTCPRRLPA